MAADSFTHSTIVSSPRFEVWAALDRPETWGSVAGVDRVRDPVMDDEGRLRGFLFDTVVGGVAYEGKATPRTRLEGQVMAWDIANSQVTGVIRIELSDVDGGTRILVGVEMSPVSMLSRMFFGAIARTVREGLAGTVERFAETF